ncbi:MAG: non-homologous end-joining DNA ligase, partial [Dokdonella sp.]
MGLKEYKRKRDFSATSEPVDGGSASEGGKQRIFVVQLHHASRRHYDFRLELDGVLKSWAVPKGPSFDPSVKRLAVEVEDHPISYAEFAGDIPEGHYGGGHVDVFDSGTWIPQGSPRNGLRDGDLKFKLHGDILRGSWVLVRTRVQGSKQQWLLIKHRDEFANDGEADDFVDAKTDRPRIAKSIKKGASTLKRSTTSPALKTTTRKRASLAGLKRAPMKNQAFDPELCRSQTTAPTGDNWLHEVKWDGYRLLTTIVRGKPRLWSRNGIEWTERLPDLVDAVRSLGLKSAQLDGEMVVLRNGRDSFNALQARLSEDGGKRGDDVVYMLFDLLYRNGESWRDVALLERKKALAKLIHEHTHDLLRYSEHQLGSGTEVFAQATTAGSEGIVSKRVDSHYRGGRGGDWVKVKSRASDEFVVVGYTEPKGSRSGIGALLLGQLHDGVLSYVGRVGTGFDDALLKSLRKQLSKSTIEEATINLDRLPASDRKAAIWVRPELVIEAFNQGYGGNGLLRQASFKTLREDKTVADLIDGVGGMKKNAIEKSSTKSAAGKSDKSSSQDKQPSKSTGTQAKSRVTITHPDRVVYKELNKTKADVADYYNKVAEHLLPGVVGRAISVVRCPGGIGKNCFFQKHAADAL